MGNNKPNHDHLTGLALCVPVCWHVLVCVEAGGGWVSGGVCGIDGLVCVSRAELPFSESPCQV